MESKPSEPRVSARSATLSLVDSVRHRPAAILFLAMSLTLIALQPGPSAGIAGLGLILAGLGATLMRASIPFLLGASLALISVWHTGFSLQPVTPGFKANVRLQVEGVPVVDESRSRVTVFADGRRLQAICPEKIDWVPGSIWRVSGTVVALNDRERWLAQRGIVGTLRFKATEAEQISDANPFEQLAYRSRKEWAIRSKLLFGADNGSWIAALAFNDDQALEDDAVQVLRSSGTYHLVSASGLHIAILAGALAWALQRVHVPKGVRYWLIGAILIFYSLATGWHEATVRATVMFLIAEAAFFVRRSKDPLSAWAVAGAGWLLFYPWALTTPGFQFSYLVTLGLILFVSGLHPAGEEHPFRLWDGLKVSVVATLASEPLAAWWFGRVTLFALVANVLIGTATSFLLVAAPLALSLMDIWPVGAEWISQEMISPSLNYVRWTLEKVAFAPSSVVELGTVSTLFLALYYGFALAMWREPSRPRLPQEPKSVQNK